MLNLATHNINSLPVLKRPGARHIISPFGSSLPSRAWSDVSRVYRYGFNGQEKDNEIAGEGSSYTAEFWQYDGRLGRRWNLDPIVKESISLYICFNNNPTNNTDKNGDDDEPVSGNKKEKRSVSKYERKFEKHKKTGKYKTDEDIHKALEKKFNNRRWMWIKDERSESGSGHHAQFFHAGDLYRTAKYNENIKTTEILQTEQYATVLDEGSTFTKIYKLPGDGIIDYEISSNGGEWTYEANQGSDPNSSNLSKNLSTDRVTLDNSPKKVALNISNTEKNGGFLYVTIVPPQDSKGGTFSASNLELTVSFTPALKKPTIYNLSSTPQNRSPHRLNKLTRKDLIQRRQDNTKGKSIYIPAPPRR